jgi:putative methionine-R-sulfoxide reductase with GAF domain
MGKDGALTSTAQVRPTGTRHDRRVWFQPLLLLAGVLMFVPVTVRRAPDALMVPLVGALATIAVASVLAHLASERLDVRARSLIGWAVMALAGVTLLGLTLVVLPDQPEHALPYAAGVAIAVAPARRSRLRLPFQLLLAGAMGIFLLAAGRPVVEAAIAVASLGFVAWLAGGLAQAMLDVRQRRIDARRASDRRAELLRAVSELSTRGAEAAAVTTVDTLRALGFSTAGVSVARSGRLVPLALAGLPPAPGLRVGDGLAGAAVAEGRTLLVEDYARDARRLPDRAGLGAAIAVPIRVDGETSGVVLGARERTGPLPAEAVEVAEVLAGHLGGVIEVEQRQDRQRELLARMQALEAMRGRLLTEVSEELRDPLTVVRGIAETLATHGDRLPEDQRARLLAGFVGQAGTLRTTIDALLDFTRLHVDRPLPALGVVRVRDLLAPLGDAVPVTGEVDLVVRTDPDLLVRALETVQALGTLRAVEVATRSGEAHVRLVLRAGAGRERSRLPLGLAEHLVVGVGGRWARDDDGVVLVLPLAPGDGGETT